jgi:hypothetical protein
MIKILSISLSLPHVSHFSSDQKMFVIYVTTFITCSLFQTHVRDNLVTQMSHGVLLATASTLFSEDRSGLHRATWTCNSQNIPLNQ